MANQSDDERSTPSCVVYGATGVATDGCDGRCRPADELFATAGETSPSVLLVDATLAARIAADDVPDHVVVVACDDGAAKALSRRADMSLAGTTDAAARRALLHAACGTATARFAVAEFEEEFHELSRIGIGLMREHDREALIRQIVAQSKALTHSDGGGLALTSQDEDGRQFLRPALYAFDSIAGEPRGLPSLYPVDDTTIIGHAAQIKRPVVVADAYDLPHDWLYEVGIAFDRDNHYRRRSMLVVPMIDQLQRVLGALILINRKTDPSAKITSEEDADRFVIEYSKREVRLARMLASQAAVAIENARLYVQLEATLESFVEASVSAIDLRDPATAGHSLRVAAMATSLARAVEHRTDGPYRDVRFTPQQMRELRFAALLHDFGKVAVREDVLLKQKKLPPLLWERIDARFDLIAETMRVEACVTPGDHARRADDALAVRLKELQRCRDLVRAANEPSPLDARTAAELRAIARCTYERPDGTMAPYLTAEELHFLELPQGTLDAAERAEIESHAAATYRYLSNIPWTDELKNMVAYASDHHELLNGEGYPRHLTADQIAIQTRIITLIDVFDALTASDRPYRHPMPAERALDILRAEAAAGRLDAELVEVLAESELHRTLHPTP